MLHRQPTQCERVVDERIEKGTKCKFRFLFIYNFLVLVEFDILPQSLQVHVKVPRVKESAFSMECEVHIIYLNVKKLSNFYSYF